MEIKRLLNLDTRTYILIIFCLIYLWEAIFSWISALYLIQFRLISFMIILTYDLPGCWGSEGWKERFSSLSCEVHKVNVFYSLTFFRDFGEFFSSCSWEFNLKTADSLFVLPLDIDLKIWTKRFWGFDFPWNIFRINELFSLLKFGESCRFGYSAESFSMVSLIEHRE